jgi:Mlc titration factor MtfA (ptsG expression regulator)
MTEHRWRAELERHVPFYRRLGPDERERLRAKVERFVDTKEIRGGPDIAVDDRIRVLVAACACRLSMNLDGEEYRRLRTVYVLSKVTGTDGEDLQGFASECFSVTLCLDSLERGLADDGDGENVGYHEFAHVLDASDGISDGIPPLLLHPELRAAWELVLPDELARLRAAVDAEIPTVLLRGATKDEAELFAYATEAFFESPERLSNAHPALYRLMALYYRQNPLERS